MNAFAGRELAPQGLKPALLADAGGTAEAVPCPKSICETSSWATEVFVSRNSICIVSHELDSFEIEFAALCYDE